MIRTLLALLLAAATAAPGLGQTRPDPGFRAWLWLQGTQPRNEALAEALRTHGFHGLSAEPSEDIGRLAALDIPYYVDQLVGDDVLALSPETWAAARKVALSEKPDHRRPRCLHDPAVMAKARADLKRRLAAYVKDPPAFVSLRDEPSFTSRLNPVDWCDAPHARPEFLRFLESRWGTREKIRSAWGLPESTDVADGEGGTPPPALSPAWTQATRDRYFHGRPDSRALVRWNDTRAFADRTFTDAVRELARCAREALPGVPIGVLGGQMPHAFGGFDWERLCRALRVIEVYDHGGVREIVRSLAAPGTRFVSTLVTADPRPPRAVVQTAWHRFLQGDLDMVVYEGSGVFVEHDLKRPTPWIQALSGHLHVMAGERLAPWRRGRDMAPQVAILVSMPSIRLHWINDTRRDGLSWVNRLTSHELEHSTQARTREAWTALLDDLGLRYRFITPTQLADGTLQKQGFRALVLPRTIAISTREVENVQEFVGSGGLLIGDCQTGLYTSHLMRRPTAALDDLFGIRRRGHDVHLDGTEIVARGRNAGLPYPIAEPKIFAAGAHPRETADGVPAVLVGTPGGGQRGRTLYLNLLVMDYVKHRLHDPKRAAWLREVVGGVLQHATVRPFVRLTRADDGAQWPIAARVRKDGADVIVALHTNVFAGSTTTPWERVLGSAPMRVQITLEGTWSVTDQVTGEALGVANRFDLLLPPDTPRILRLSR